MWWRLLGNDTLCPHWQPPSIPLTEARARSLLTLRLQRGMLLSLGMLVHGCCREFMHQDCELPPELNDRESTSPAQYAPLWSAPSACLCSLRHADSLTYRIFDMSLQSPIANNPTGARASTLGRGNYCSLTCLLVRLDIGCSCRTRPIKT